jgi:hypothetical protein
MSNIFNVKAFLSLQTLSGSSNLLYGDVMANSSTHWILISFFELKVVDILLCKK